MGLAVGEEVHRTSSKSHLGPEVGRSPYDFVLLNFKIVKLAQNALEVIQERGRHSPATKEVVKKLLCEYRHVSKRPETMSHVNVSTMLHRTARVMTKVGSVNSLSKHFPDLLENLVDGVYTWHHMFEPRHTSTAIWSFGKLGKQVLSVSGSVATFPGAFSCLMQKAALQVKAFSCKEITSILTGIAALQLKVDTCEPLITTLLHRASNEISNFPPRELATCTWAFATIGYDFGDETGFLDDSITAFERYLTSRKVHNQELVNFMWALAKLRYTELPLGFYNTVDSEVLKRMHSMEPLGLSNLLWAFAKLRFLPSVSTLQAAAQHAAKNIDQYEPQQVSRVLYSFATFGMSFDTLASKSQVYFTSKVDQFGRQELCNLLWALAILDELDMDTFLCAISAIKTIPGLSFDGMGDAELRQLHDCLVDVRCFSNKKGDDELMPLEWENTCIEAHKKGQEEKKVYGTALSVLLTLQKMGSFTQCHQMFDPLSKALDVAVDRNGIRIGVEVSLPGHYFINNGSKLRGQRLWAMRTMEAQGLILLRVDCRQWTGLSQDERVHYIKEELGL